MNWTNQCHFGDVRDVLRRMIADGVKVNTIVTSPPYWGLRSYLPAGHADKGYEIGSEPTLREFLNTMVEVFDLAREVLRDDGTMWVNMGDSYAANRSYQVPSTLMNGDATNQAQAGDGRGMKAKDQGYKVKDLMGQPWRLAFALQDAGWYLRQDIIWHKPNPMPESVTDRCTKAHEYLFLLTKRADYYCDMEAVKEPIAAASAARYAQNVDAQEGSDRVPGKTNGKMKAVGGPRAKGNRKTFRGGGVYTQGQSFENHTVASNDSVGNEPNESGLRNRRSVWTVATRPYKGAHFATFPEALVEPCILAGCPVGGIVLDPFFGSGTTGQVAQNLGRRFIGIEINRDNEPLQRERLSQPGLDLEAA